MYKLSFKKRTWIVKQHQQGISASKLALAQKIHRSTIYQILSTHAEYGWEGLKDHKTGRSETVLNPNAVIIILDLRKRFGLWCVPY